MIPAHPPDPGRPELLYLLGRGGNWDPEGFGILPKVTQLVRTGWICVTLKATLLTTMPNTHPLTMDGPPLKMCSFPGWEGQGCELVVMGCGGHVTRCHGHVVDGHDR